jgi:uncharacterized membrane protein
MKSRRSTMERLATAGLTGRMSTLASAALIAATICTGLMAGLFAGFAFAVMPGLRRTDARTFVDAMRQINAAILNAWFALPFAGALVLSALAAALQLASGEGATLGWTAAGLLLYVATLAVTFRVNVPLNDALAAEGRRERFERPWVRANIVRALTCTAALGCLAGALSA